MSYKHSSIEYNVIHLFDEDEDIICESIKSLFRSEMGIPEVSVNKRIETNSDEENDVVTFHGKFGFKNLSDGINKLLVRFCQRNRSKNNNKRKSGILLNFENSLFSEILTEDKTMLKHQIKITQFSFGTMTRLTSFVYHYSSSIDLPMELGGLRYSVSICEDDMLARFVHSCGEIHVHFRVIFKPIGKSTVKYRYKRFKFVISYSSINNITLKATDKNLLSYVSVLHPPLLYYFNKDKDMPSVYKKDDEEYLEVSNEDVMFDSNSWSRCLNFPSLSTEILAYCTVIKLNLFEHPNRQEICSHEEYQFPHAYDVLNSLLKVKNVFVYFGDVREYLKNIPESIVIPQNHEDYFRVAYALECLQSISFQFANDLLFESESNKVEEKLSEDLRKLAVNSEALEKSLFELFELISNGVFVRVLPFLTRNVTRNENFGDEDKRLKEANLYMNRKAILTPSRLMLLPPLPMSCSRFILKSDPDYILRLLIRDDTLDTLTFSVAIKKFTEKQKFFEQCIKQRLLSGLKVCDRIYELVGSSPSQLKQNGMVLYAKDREGRTAQSIISEFGTINERNVSKYVSRIGLILSQAQHFFDVSDARIKYDEPDITHRLAVHPESKKRYLFSDGCGMISEEYAAKLTEKLKEVGFLPKEATVPSAFQIRLGGCKGMLVVNPRLQNYDIVIRDSMRKFESDDKLLGVLKVSDKRKVYLNKPFITVLNQLGIDTNVFLNMQMDVLQNILHSFLKESSAVEILQQYSFLHNVVDYKTLVEANVHILNEPFIRMILDNVIRQATFILRTKGRIQIPMERGRTVFGVVDETYTLNYGEVFVQVTDANNPTKTQIWTGKLLVAKFPSIDGGDPRILKAVDVEDLHHIKDCIVFPAKGKRPHPNETAGSDLDGDEYAVIKTNELLNFRVQPPMTFPDSNTAVEEISPESILDFYVDYILNFSVGVVSHAHLAWADFSNRGIFDERCKRLAKMASLAVDFAKTGINCTLQDDDRPKVCPDFMEKFSHKPTYLSDRALGSLFRQISLFQIVFNEDLPMNFERADNQLFEHPLSQQFSNEARSAYFEYKHLMFNIQKTFKINTEAEIICGVYNNEDKFMVGGQEAFDSKNVVGIILKKGVSSLYKSFFDNCTDEELQLAKVSAYYKVTKLINWSSDTPYYGLPWLFSKYLAKLAKRNQTETRTEPDDAEKRLLNIGSLIDDRLIEYNKMCTNDVSRVRLAEEIIISWQKRQTHLKLHLFTSQVLLENKVRTILQQNNYRYCPSVGLIVIYILKRLLSEEMNEEFGSIAHTKHFKFTVGFSAMTALYRMYRTNCIDHIILPRKLTIVKSVQLTTKSFRLPFNQNSALFDFVKIKENEFFKYLRALCGIYKLKGEWIMKSKCTWHFELMAFGTSTQIHALCFVLSKTLFAKGPNIVAMIEEVVSSENKK